MNSRKYQIWVKLPDSEDAPEMDGEVTLKYTAVEIADAFERNGMEVYITYTEGDNPKEFKRL